MKQFCEQIQDFKLEIELDQRFDFLPLGQKLMKLGLQPTSHEDLRGWFKCDEIQKRENEKLERRRNIQARWNIRKMEWENKENPGKSFWLDEVNQVNETIWDRMLAKGSRDAFERERNWRRQRQQDMLNAQALAGIIPDSTIRINSPERFTARDFNLIGSRRLVCDVAYEPLEAYMKDLIPDYVLDHLAEAREFGFTHFEVAYPEMKEIQLPDPVLLGVVGEKKFFISFWE